MLEMPDQKKGENTNTDKSGCVTIYTWPASENSSDRIQGMMGHSALRTYSGGSTGKGVYVSFYPGNCDRKPRVASCRKIMSHFHTWNQEMSKETIDKATFTDLYGLDINLINQDFQELHNDEMNSHKPWSNRYNCSDVVLSLLGSGELFKKVDCRPYGWKSIFLASLIASNVTRNFTNLGLFIILEKIMKRSYFRDPLITALLLNNNFDNEYLFQQLGNQFDKKNETPIQPVIDMLNTDVEDSFLRIFYYKSIDSIASCVGAIPITYSYFLLVNKRVGLPAYLCYRNALTDTLIAGLVSISEKLIYLLARAIISPFSIQIAFGNFPGEFIEKRASIFSGKLWNMLLMDNLATNSAKSAIKAFVTVTLILIPILLFKYFYETTTTPQHVCEIVKQAELTLQSPDQNIGIQKRENINNYSGFFKNISGKFYENKYTILAGLGIGGLAATIGLFALRDNKISENLSNVNSIGFSL